MKLAYFKYFLVFLILIACQTEKDQHNKQNTEKLKQISQYLDWEVEHDFSGVLLISKEGEIVFEDAFGYSNRENRKKNTVKTIFDIGSLTKQFTAAAILKLQEEGKISVRDSISRFFANVPADKAAITIHQLLIHTGGFRRSAGDPYDRISRMEFLRRAFNSKLLYPPDSVFNYSNIGYSILGAIIEICSGTSYEQYLKEHLFMPAKMEETGYVLPNWEPERIAVGYRNGRYMGKPNDYPWDSKGPYWNLHANGGLLSSAEDLFKWHLALEEGKILSKESIEAYYKPYVREKDKNGYWYAYGWAVFNTPRNTKLITHRGGNRIFFTDYLKYRDEDIVVCLLSNNYKKGVNNIAWEATRILLWDDYTPPMREHHILNLQELPMTEKGLAIQEFSKLVDHGGSMEVQKFVNQYLDEHLHKKHGNQKLTGAVRSMQAEIGHHKIHDIRFIDDKIFELKLESVKTGRWYLLTVIFDNQNSGKIYGFIINEENPDFN